MKNLLLAFTILLSVTAVNAEEKDTSACDCPTCLAAGNCVMNMPNGERKVVKVNDLPATPKPVRGKTTTQQ